MEEQVEVEIVTATHSARYGAIPVGATLRTDQAYADHLVYDCGAAKFPKPKLSETVVQTSAQPDPYAHLGTLVAVVPGAADENVQTSAQTEEPEVAAAESAAPADQ